MEKIAVASSICPNPHFAGAPASSVRHRPFPSFFLLASQKERLASARNKRFFVFASKSSRIESVSSKESSNNVFERLKFQGFSSISSSTKGRLSTSTAAPPPVPPPPSYIGSPLFWVGIGVGLAALFSVAVNKVKQYALQQAMKTMMNPSPQSGSPFANPAFPGGSSPFPFPFPMPPQPQDVPTPSPSSFSSPPPPVQPKPVPPVTVDTPVQPSSTAEKKFSFVDVSPEKKEAEIPPPPPNKSVEPEILGSTNGNAYSQQSTYEYQSQSQSQSQTPGGAPFLSVDQLEKMMEDPTVQKMVYPYLPEEMRNPTTFKWMMQNPEYRQQLQDMLNNMGGNPEWDNKMMDSMKNFDLSSPEVKQQFEQIGLTPEEVISKIMSNPDVAVAFQNPRVQAAIMDCSQNPLNIAKYQNDKEVMDVFTKIAELFPGVSG